MKAALVAGVLTVAAGGAAADELLFHTFSVHGHKRFFNDDGSSGVYNNTNLGVGWRTDGSYVLGAYYNSYRRPTVYAGRWLLWEVSESVQLGGWAALATGYKDYITRRELNVIGALTFRYSLGGGYSAYISGVPRLGATDAVVNFTLGKELR